MPISKHARRLGGVCLTIVVVVTACASDNHDSAESTTTTVSTTTSQSTITGAATTIDELGLSLQLPPGWVQDVDYGEWAFFGDDGFLVLTVLRAPGGLETLAMNEAGHALAPYGTDPTIEVYSVDDREARLIVPSSDSPAVVEGNRQSAVIVPWTEPDSYLAMFSDPTHIEQIASSLRWQT